MFCVLKGFLHFFVDVNRRKITQHRKGDSMYILMGKTNMYDRITVVRFWHNFSVNILTCLKLLGVTHQKNKNC